MQNTSSLYKELIKQSGRLFKAEIIVTFPNGSTTTLTDENIMQDSLSITTGTTDEGSFSIGNAIIGQLDFEIDNRDGDYHNLSFGDAVLDVRVGLIVRQSYDGTMTPEWLRKGIFTAEEVTVDENYIRITAYDNLAKLDVPFSGSGITFPITLGNLYQQICAFCSVPYGNMDFPNAGLVIGAGAELDENTSCRDVLSCIAQLACRFVYADVNGTVKLGWYRETDYAVSEQQKLNGTVTVTGVQLTDAANQTTLTGTKNYCLMIDDNPLALTGAAMSDPVWEDVLVGMELTPFSAELLSDPSLEAGDIVTVSDLHGNTYRTPVTNLIYRLDGKMTVSCDAETIKEKQRTSSSPSARIAAQTNRRINRKIAEYDVRAKQFSMLMANAMGFFQTDVTQSDGSTVSYLHDKPLLADSQTIWKRSIDGFAVSTDGGQTYSAGFDSQGNAVLNILSAAGIIANWIRVGTLSGVSIIGESGSIGGWTIDGNRLISADGTMILDGNSNTITVNDADGKKFMQIQNGGVTYFRPDHNDVMKEIGSIGVTKAADADTYGVTFNLKDGDAMTWSVYNQTAGNYNNVLRYEASNEKFILNGDLEINGDITAGNITNGISTDNYIPVTGDFWALTDLVTNPDGTIASRTSGTVSVKNGLIVAW